MSAAVPEVSVPVYEQDVAPYIDEAEQEFHRMFTKHPANEGRMALDIERDKSSAAGLFQLLRLRFKLDHSQGEYQLRQYLSDHLEGLAGGTPFPRTAYLSRAYDSSMIEALSHLANALGIEISGPYLPTPQTGRYPS